MSVEPDPVTVTDATFCQLSEPPATFGMVGRVRSMRTVACTQLETRPTLSMARKRTSVSPSPLTVRAAPDVGSGDQVAPPFVDCSYS